MKQEARRHNSGFAKKRVQWLIEHSTSHQLLWYVDSLVLRNRQLLVAAKRYVSYLPDRKDITHWKYFRKLTQ